MLPEITDKHREIFKSLASGWMRVGATCVQLLEGDRVLVGCPDSLITSAPALTATSRAGNLSLRVYGVADVRWLSTAESVLEIFSILLTSDADMDSLTAALVETQDRLVALYDLTQATRRTLDVQVLLDLLIQQSKHLMNVDGGFVVLKEKGKKSIIYQDSEIPLHAEHLEAAATLYYRDPNRHILKDVGTLPVGLQNVMMVSLPVRDEISAAIGLFNKTGNFTTPDIKLAKAIAGHIGAQLETAMLHKEAVERTRLETEMNIARQVQTAILPQTLPHVASLDLYATSIPAFEVGGDFFDMSESSKGLLIFALGDVTGKGIPAAFLMSMTHTVIKSASRNMPFTHPHQIIDRLNHDMFGDFSNVGMFTTVLIGQVNREASQLTFSNAGQSPIYYVPVNGEPQLLEAQDVPVGVLDTYKYSSQVLNFSQGDIFVAASDGFPESRNPAGEMFGYERMKNSLSASRNLSAQQIADRLLADVNNFSGEQPQDDDRTIVIIKFQKRKEDQFMQNEVLTVNASYKDIRLPGERLRALCTANHVPDEIAGMCELALQELLTNLVDHAYDGDQNQLITVRLACDSEKVVMETRDTGKSAQVDINSAVMPEPTDLAEGGYGLAIIQSLMSEVGYVSDQGTNTWTLIKQLK